MSKKIADGALNTYAPTYPNFVMKYLEELFEQINIERRLYRLKLGEARVELGPKGLLCLQPRRKPKSTKRTQNTPIARSVSDSNV